MIIQFVIVSTVFELLLDPPTHVKFQVRGYGDITAVEQCVDIATQEQAILWIVRATFRKWFDMRRFKCWQCSFTRDCAFSLIRVGHHDAKCALT